MLLLSVGMPRAGSGWYYNLNHDLLVAGGGQDARAVRRQYHLTSILTEVNCNIGALTPWRLLPVMLPALQGKSYTIKAHCAPTPLARALIKRGWLRATYIYRDPRDAMLSSFENGQRALQNGRQNAFSHLTTFEKTLDFMREYVHIWQDWMALPQVLHARYEDLLTDYDNEVQRLLRFLQLESTSAVQQIVELYRPAKVQKY